MPAKLRPLSTFPNAVRRGIRCVLCDIDDTLTIDGRLTSSAYAAMERLSRAGLAVVPVTGRPAGWCDLIARQWPVTGVIGENGAFYFRYAPAERRVVRQFWFDDERRQADRARLAVLAEAILSAVPAAALASDQRYRETDLAIDWCEDVARLSQAEIDRIVALAEDAGATVRVSSIHINIWFGEFSKLSMTRRFIDDVFAAETWNDARAFVFVGDSPNDSTMFSFFENSVGVANVLNFRGAIETEPTYVTAGMGGDGFAELGDALLSAQQSGRAGQAT
ncbi:MAG: HAD-IIB family hydrolase [Alphaproteobacteria bacterium]|nr:HAD-IIB family hydrolase [Alphaproteobacteria bacterium]